MTARIRSRLQVIRDVDPGLYKVCSRTLALAASMMLLCCWLGLLWVVVLTGLISAIASFGFWVLWLATRDDAEHNPAALYALLGTLTEPDVLSPLLEHRLAEAVDLYARSGIFPAGFRNDVTFSIMREERRRATGKAPTSIGTPGSRDQKHITPERMKILEQLMRDLRERIPDDQLQHV